MAASMRQLQFIGEGKTRLVEALRPTRGPGEVLVKIAASALCGSEREDLIRGHASNFGHEASGHIVEVDENAGYAVGELVGLYAVLGCGECAECVQGRETMCLRGPEILSGWHSDYVVVPVRSLRKVDQSTDPAVAALMTGDPLGVPARSLRRVPTAAGSPVIVVGLGPVGLAHVLLRSYLGADVIGIEPSEYRRQQALALGASAVFAPGEYTGRADVVIECTGVPGVIARHRFR
jgi:threonine dehydrogenase-like Zn-dependent dehydrogenase